MRLHRPATATETHLTLTSSNHHAILAAAQPSVTRRTKAQADAEYGRLLTDRDSVPGALAGQEAVAFALARANSATDL